MFNRQRSTQDEFNATIIVRTAIILAGLGLRPNKEAVVDLAVKVAEEMGKEEDKVPMKRDWNLYKLEVDNPCPIHCLMMPHWLVRGSLDALGVDEYPFDTIEPTAWITNLPEVLDWLPERLVDTTTRLIASNIINAAAKAPEETLTAIREALKKKGEAIANRTPCISIGENEDGVSIAIVVL